MSNQIKKVIYPSVSVFGIKKRCRKETVQVFSLDDVDPAHINREELVKQAKALLIRNMKTIKKAYLSLIPTELEDYGNGIVIRSMNLSFNGEKIPLTVES